MGYLWAFLVGGAICAAGQLLIDLTSLTPARILTGYVVAGVALSALGLYGPLADLAGAGASVPLLGFGHLLAQGVRQAVAQQGLLGWRAAGRGRRHRRQPDLRGGGLLAGQKPGPELTAPSTHNILLCAPAAVCWRAKGAFCYVLHVLF